MVSYLCQPVKLNFLRGLSNLSQLVLAWTKLDSNSTCRVKTISCDKLMSHDYPIIQTSEWQVERRPCHSGRTITLQIRSGSMLSWRYASWNWENMNLGLRVLHHERSQSTSIQFRVTVVVRLRIIVRVMVRVKVRFWVGVRVRIMGTELMSHVSACETKSTKYRWWTDQHGSKYQEDRQLI